MIICLPVILYAELLIVDIEGNFDYTSIQTAVEAAVNGDTILVYPGEYIENVNYNGKSIVIGSLYLTTEEEEYIENTIINGNRNGSCVYVISGEGEGTELCGFTVTNGNGDNVNSAYRVGGGIIIDHSQIILFHCIIINNIALYHGGISITEECDVLLKGCTITNNQAAMRGGGISFVNGNSNIVFDQEDRCSIYNNHAGVGYDIYCTDREGNIIVYLDMFTCDNGWGYNYIQYGNHELSEGYPVVEYQQTWIDLVDADLYVAPWGSDENSGLTEDDPLQSITRAMYIIKPGFEIRHTIYLASGIYSVSQTGELFPFPIKSGIILKGESCESTIIDAENNNSFINTWYTERDIKLVNLRFINSRENLEYNVTSRGNPTADAIHINPQIYGDIYFENLVFCNNNSSGIFILIETFGEVFMDNISIHDNGQDNTRTNIRIMPNNHEHQTRHLLNKITLRNNNFCDFDLMGEIPMTHKYYLSNILMSNNREQYEDNDIYNSSGFWMCFPQETYFINCTIAVNDIDIPSPSGVIQLSDGVNLDIRNSIIYDNNTDYLFLDYNAPYTDCEVNISNCLFDFNESEISSTGYTQVYWNDETIFEGEPQFTGMGNHPQSLSHSSPCVDGGTMEMPEGFVIPETDVAGNPRIWGEMIDIGAYEWNPLIAHGQETYSPFSSGTGIEGDQLQDKGLIVFPNPVKIKRDRANLNFELPYSGRILSNFYLEIFNIRGQIVKIIELSKETSMTCWNCCDETGTLISAGIYFARLKAGKEYYQQVKFIVVK